MKHGTAMRVMIPIRDASSAWREPTLDEILSDSIVEAVMRADSVDPKELRALLVRIAHTRRLTAGADFVPCFPMREPGCVVTEGGR
jgi:hypothetical protein